tara:strand:+ start:235 stop:711 length:477 start_codon:yes stop_codon:yes gene_type:complete
MEIIDNFLSDYYFKSLSNIILSDEFDWYYNGCTVMEGDGQMAFIHSYYNDIVGPTPSFCQIESYLPFFNVKEVYRIKANLAPRTVFHRKSGWHVDNFPCSTTAILYMNTNNGWTEFKKRGRVKSVANRAVIFDSNLEHRGVTCTDVERRVLINFNYEV